MGPHKLLTAMQPPYAGWMECPEPECGCWSTWSANHPDLPSDVLARIDVYLDELRRAHYAERN